MLLAIEHSVIPPPAVKQLLTLLQSPGEVGTVLHKPADFAEC
jgi:hypothetical protein